MALSLAAESWTWYSFVILVVIFRFISRVIHLGSWKRLQIEDFLMLFIVVLYTNLVGFMQIVATADTNLMLPEDIPTLTPESIQSRIYGSKLVLVVEQCMIMTQWGCKICLLLIYYNLTMGLRQTWTVKIVGCYVVTCWAVMEILYFGVWCQPFDQYWAVPVANDQCSTALHHLIVNAVFNITSDLMMLCIPLPLLLKLQLPLLKKMVLCCLFGLGIFVILCAVLNKYYSFTEPFSPIWTFWYIREASTAILVANMPNCWPLLRRIFHLRSFSGGLGSSSDPAAATGTSGGGSNSHHLHLPMSAVRQNALIGLQGVKISSSDDLDRGGAWDARRRMYTTEQHEMAKSSESSESLAHVSASSTPDGMTGGGHNKATPLSHLQIWQDVEIIVHEFDAGDGQSSEGRKEIYYDGMTNAGSGEGDSAGFKTVVSARGV